MQIREIDDPRLVKALAHPMRIQILRLLADRVASPSEIANEIDARVTNVSYHVRFLERIGLIELVRTRPRRGAIEHYYRARGRLRITDRVWNQIPETIKNAVIDSTLAQAIRQITAAAAEGGFKRDDCLASRWSLVLDEQGFREVSAIVHGALAQVKKLEEESAKRMANDDHANPAINTGLVTMLFEAAPVELEIARDGQHAARRAGGAKRTARARAR